MRATILSAALAAAIAMPAAAADKYGFDASHTEVMASWNHVGISYQTLEFLSVDGEITFDREDIASSAMDVTIKADSVHTGFAKFDDHLKAADFFDVANHPEIRFVSTAVRQTGVDRGEIDGTLTIKGVSKPVTLDVEMLFDGPHPLGAFIDAYKGADYAGFRATTQVLRSEFDLGKFAPLTSDHIDIVINAELRKK